LNEKIEKFQNDLSSKIDLSKWRFNEKQKVLAKLPRESNLPASDVSPEMKTRQQIMKVISREETIQSDLKACIEKVLFMKQKLGQKVTKSVRVCTIELQAINQLIQVLLKAWKA